MRLLVPWMKWDLEGLTCYHWIQPDPTWSNLIQPDPTSKANVSFTAFWAASGLWSWGSSCSSQGDQLGCESSLERRQRKLKIRQDFEAQKGHSHTCVVPKTQATWIATARIDWLQAQECPSLMVDRENISQNLSLWRLSPFSGHLKFSDQPKLDARIIGWTENLQEPRTT
jgi:hypothetical protein